MEPFNAGWLSIVPPIVAIALALITKEVLSSLVLGILTGTLIYTIGTDGNVLMGTLESAFTVMGNKVDFNILIFCSLLGALVYVVAMSGGTKAYGNWAVKRIKGRKSALAATTGLGALIELHLQIVRTVLEHLALGNADRMEHLRRAVCVDMRLREFPVVVQIAVVADIPHGIAGIAHVGAARLGVKSFV